MKRAFTRLNAKNIKKRFINIIVVVGAGIFVGIIGYFFVNRLPYAQNQKTLVLPNGVVNDTEVSGWRKIEVASGGGFRGPWRMNESEFLFVDDPTVALSDEGIVGIAWADQARQDIFLQIYESNGKPRFNEPVNVSKSPRIFSWLPRMVFGFDNANEVYILWQEIIFLQGSTHGGEIFFARSIDGGRTFDNPLNLSDTIAGEGKGRLTSHHWDNGSLDLVISSEGNLYVAWTEFEGALHFSYSIDRGVSFSTPRHIAGGSVKAPARGPSIAVNTEGVVYLSWAATRDRISDIYFAKSTDYGRVFSKPIRLLTGSSGHLDAPRIVVDNKAVIHLVYAKSPDGLFGQYHIRHTTSNDNGKTFKKSKKISAGIDINQWSASFPVIDIDGQDNLYIIWEIFPDRRHRSAGLGFTFSNDGGQTFELPIVIPGAADPLLGFNGSQQGLLMRKLAVNETGMIAIVNSTFRENIGSYIWFHLREAIGR